MKTHALVNIGTCSWKYDSWRGLIYPGKKPINYLQEYSRHYNTVEVDQWFWSLFKGDKVVLPKASVVAEYASSVPDDFIFSIKVPNSITLTHHYKNKSPLLPNPHFLSVDLMNRFLDSIEPLADNIGPLIFQFEYLNKLKMSSISEFINQFKVFAECLPERFDYFVETRNPNYLTKEYFHFLADHHLHHVFLQGYYMPSVFDLYYKHKAYIRNLSTIRLHGPDRQEIEKKTGKNWSKIVAPKDHEITSLTEMIEDMVSQEIQTYIYVNNHFEGSAPRTISRIEEQLLNRCNR